MRILLTNDDGIYAPGLRAMRQELLKLGQVAVVAPATEQSAAGHSVTLLNPLVVQEVFLDDGKEFVGWAVEGRPADCVKLALLELLPGPPDLIVSGINAGSNSGINVLYSGTVAAAIEGAFFRVTSIAVSQQYATKIVEYHTPAMYAKQVIDQILATKPEKGSLFNVNLPTLERGPIRGVRIVPQNVSPYVEKLHRRVDPRGRTYFWLGNDFGCPDPHPNTDESALAEQFISITPLQFNLTDHSRLEGLRSQKWKIEAPTE
jgi:5'-nucleotidase